MDKKISKTFYEKYKSAIITSTLLIFLSSILIIYAYINTGILSLKKEQITVYKVIVGEFQEFIPIDASIIPASTIYIDAVSGGQVEEVYAEDGDYVKKGSRLAKLSNTSLVLDMMNREMQLFEQENFLRNSLITYEQNKLILNEKFAAAEYNFLKAERAYKNNKNLFEKSLISKNDLENSKEEFDLSLKNINNINKSVHQDSLFKINQIDQLQFSLKRLQNNYKIIKETIDNLTFYAPMDGQLTGFNLVVGQSIKEQEKVGQIDQLNTYKAVAFIDEHYLNKIYKNISAIGDYKNLEIKMFIKKVYPTINAGKVQIDLEFVSSIPKELSRGQRLQLKLELGSASKEILLKRGAFYNSTGGNWVFKRNANTKIFEKQEVKINKQNPSFFTIDSGLEKDDEVIISAYDNFRDIEQIILN